jgi:hypothetical protein
VRGAHFFKFIHIIFFFFAQGAKISLTWYLLRVLNIYFKHHIFLIKISPLIPSACFSHCKAAFRSIFFPSHDLFHRVSFVTPTIHVGPCREVTFTMLWPKQPNAGREEKDFRYPKINKFFNESRNTFQTYL